MKNNRRICILFLLGLTITFQPFAKNNSSEDELFKSLAETLSRVEKKLPNKTVAVYGFEVIGRPGDSYAVFATEKLNHELVSNGTLLVIERSKIDQVLKEQSLSMTGAIDAGTAAKIGQILSVDAVIIGTIHVTDSGRSELKPPQPLQPVNQLDEPAKDNSKSKTVLKPSKNIYASDEQIEITYSGMPGNKQDWITLIKASEPENTYGEWFYTSGQKSGSYSFKVVEPGDYEIRVYYNWPSGGYTVHKKIKIRVN